MQGTFVLLLWVSCTELHQPDYRPYHGHCNSEHGHKIQYSQLQEVGRNCEVDVVRVNAQRQYTDKKYDETLKKLKEKGPVTEIYEKITSGLTKGINKKIDTDTSYSVPGLGNKDYHNV